MCPPTEVLVLPMPGDARAELEAVVARCAEENGGGAVGEPSVVFDGNRTDLSFAANSDWWLENLRVHLLPRAREAWGIRADSF